MTPGPTPVDARAEVAREPLEPGAPRRMLGWVRRPARPGSSARIKSLLIALCMVVLTVAFGASGFRTLHLPMHERLGVFQSIYHALRLYTFDLGVAGGGFRVGPNWQIVVAQVLAAALLVRGALALFKDRARRVATRYAPRGHVIVCGAGVHGTELAKRLSDRHDVVLVDVDDKALGMLSPLGRYEWRIVGDCLREETLRAAGAARAHWVVAITGNDYVSSQIVSVIRSLAEDRILRDRVHAIVQIEDPSLARFLEEETEPAPASAGARPKAPAPRPVVSPFSTNSIAAEALLAESVRKLESGDRVPMLSLPEGDALNLLVAGDHPLIDAIILAALRRWRVDALRALEAGSAARPAPVHISLLGPDAVGQVERLRRRWQPEAHALAIEPRDSEQAGATSAETDDWLRKPGRAHHAIVACLQELDGVRLTLEISRALGDRVLMTRVTTEPESVLDRHLEDHTLHSDQLAAIEVKSISELACKPEALGRLAGRDRLADALAAQGRPVQASAGLFARDELGVHSDLAWRVLESERSMLKPLLAPVPVSALLDAGLAVNLSSPRNLRAAAEGLSAGGHEHETFVAWCEYARHVTTESPLDVRAGLERPPVDPIASEILRLRAGTLTATDSDDASTGEGPLADARRVVIFAGGVRSLSLEAVVELMRLLKRALIGYDGVILCGGTDVGLPGVVGLVARELGLRRRGYVPAGRGSPDLYPDFRETPNATDFSVCEPLGMWDEIVRAGISVQSVCVVACPGGPITTAELLLARALGARVAWIDPAGEATATLDDTLPLGADGVLELPVDAMTTRAYLKSSRLPDELREPVAKYIHNDYRRKHRTRKAPGDPALAPWDDLLGALKQSNLAQADDIPNKLALIGKQLAKPGHRLELIPDEVDLLAEVEHGRWNIERLASAWQLGQREIIRGISPHLKPWSELDDEAREYDREAVRNIDRALKPIGWGVEPR